MKRFGDQFFSGAAFTPNQNRRVAVADLIDIVKHLSHARIFADNVAKLIFIFKGRFKIGVFFGQLFLFRGVTDDELEVLHIERLGNIIVCTFLHGLNGGFGGGITGHHNNRRSRANTVDSIQNINTIGTRHVDIGDHDIITTALDHFDRNFAVASSLHFIALLTQGDGKHFPHALFIIDN